MVIMTPMFNYQLPPVIQNTSPELLEATKKMMKYIKKSYKHNAKATMMVLTVTIPVQTNTAQFVQANTNANFGQHKLSE